MMSNERALLRAKVADAKRQLEEKNLLAEQYAMELREMLSPSIMDYGTQLPILSLRKTFEQLDMLWVEMRDLKRQLGKMENTING